MQYYCNTMYHSTFYYEGAFTILVKCMDQLLTKANFNSCLLSSRVDDIYPVLIICFVYKMNPFQKLAKHSFYLCYKHLPPFIFVNIPVSNFDNKFGTILILKSQPHLVNNQQTIKFLILLGCKYLLRYK